MVPDSTGALAVLWGKSNAGGRANLLLQHLLDSAAVGELIWDFYLAPAVKRNLDDSCQGQGRVVFALLCGLHDCGKAVPAFQCKDDGLSQKVRRIGLVWPALNAEARRWHHSCAGAVIASRVLLASGWSPETVGWVWPVIAGHHGLIPSDEIFAVARRLRNAQGRGGQWETAQDQVVQAVASALDVDLRRLSSVRVPRRGVQLALSGAVIMADWIASGEHFVGFDEIADVSMSAARERARDAWSLLDLRGGWVGDSYVPVPDLVAARFGRGPARPVQAAAVTLAEQMSAPGLVVIEAPMGEGKTEAALAAAEVLGRRFGHNGVFVGLPTQATSDPMFERVLAWAEAVEPGLPVGLLHGKRMFNPRWAQLQSQVRFVGIDEYGCADEYATGSGRWVKPDQAPPEWFLGPKRGMLMPVAVGTVDNLLHAATRTKHVMLRHAGLANRVVVIDEVHAYDVYMSQFLEEALRWLADAGVPVILLSATLAPGQRAALARAYEQGARGTREVDTSMVAAITGYPVIHAVSVDDPAPVCQTPPTWRSSAAVTVRVVQESPKDGPDAVVDLLAEELSEGGCALVIRNTIGRAQQTYQALQKVMRDDEVVLLHGRLTVGERADRTAKILNLLAAPGAPGAVGRPARLVVVATQIAEQSFDVDADLLVTDLAPVDLLLQRIGRIHRHDRPATDRPVRLRRPQVVVTGMTTGANGVPVFPSGSEFVYGRHLLLRTAVLVQEAAAGRGWSIPADVPDLVRRAYGDEDITPEQWRESSSQAHLQWVATERQRQGAAASFLLCDEENLGATNLVGLHGRATGDLPDDDAVAAVVRDGPETVEVVLVRAEHSGYLTLQGSSLGPNGDGVSDPEIARSVVGSTLRLPPALTAAAKADLKPLPGWDGNAWLRRSRALVLDGSFSTSLGGHRLTYDADLGLLHTRQR
ncbi:CRISPR-associated helicase Cas3' [Micromonospora sp. NPDC023633]|uniref:CRISPR-associated helicase Cas3' n=1 Tax=Micromonospora sp. NPDC023633 TaxID=3154320 RepID=UPI0033F17222